MHLLIALFASQKAALRGAVACACAAAMLWAAPALSRAAPLTPAGTVIENVAALTYTQNNQTTTLASNTVSLQVQELLDVSVEVLTPELQVEANSTNQRLMFRVRNLGNGPQAFDLSLSMLDTDDFDPHSCSIIIDWDGDGVLSIPPDRVTTTTPVLEPNQAVLVWVSCSIPAGVTRGALGRVVLRAIPTVLRGVSGTGQTPIGTRGLYTVIGRTLGGGTGGGTNGGGTNGGSGGGDGGATSPPATYQVGSVNAQLIKSQSVRDALDGSLVLVGSIVTYTLEARIGAGAAASQVRITDAIPDSSTYVDGSLTLDGVALTDADDGDAGRFANGAIEVGVGDMPAQTSRVVTFKVRINRIVSSQ